MNSDPCATVTASTTVTKLRNNEAECSVADCSSDCRWYCNPMPRPTHTHHSTTDETTPISNAAFQVQFVSMSNIK